MSIFYILHILRIFSQKLFVAILSKFKIVISKINNIRNYL